MRNFHHSNAKQYAYQSIIYPLFMGDEDVLLKNHDSLRQKYKENGQRMKANERKTAVDSSAIVNFIRLHFMSLKSKFKYSLITTNYDMHAFPLCRSLSPLVHTLSSARNLTYPIVKSTPSSVFLCIVSGRGDENIQSDLLFDIYIFLLLSFALRFYYTFYATNTKECVRLRHTHTDTLRTVRKVHFSGKVV